MNKLFTLTLLALITASAHNLCVAAEQVTVPTATETEQVAAKNKIARKVVKNHLENKEIALRTAGVIAIAGIGLTSFFSLVNYMNACDNVRSAFYNTYGNNDKTRIDALTGELSALAWLARALAVAPILGLASYFSFTKADEAEKTAQQLQD